MIWIDADSCPLLVRNHVVKTGAKNNIQVTLVANKKINCTVPFSYNMVVCPQKKDAADDYIFQNCKKGDLVITKDIVFADRILSKEVLCINDRGKEFTKENIKELLEDRQFDIQIEMSGAAKHFNEGYDQKKFDAFLKCFGKIFTLLQNQE